MTDDVSLYMLVYVLWWWMNEYVDWSILVCDDVRHCSFPRGRHWYVSRVEAPTPGLSRAQSPHTPIDYSLFIQTFLLYRSFPELYRFLLLMESSAGTIAALPDLPVSNPTTNHPSTRPPCRVLHFHNHNSNILMHPFHPHPPTTPVPVATESGARSFLHLQRKCMRAAAGTSIIYLFTNFQIWLSSPLLFVLEYDTTRDGIQVVRNL